MSDECDCGKGGSSAMAYQPRPQQALKPVKKPRKPRSKGKGSYCVLSHKGRVVHCYESSATANRVAEAFTSRGRAGTQFTVKKRSAAKDTAS